jgi:hypothetical protein
MAPIPQEPRATTTGNPVPTLPEGRGGGPKRADPTAETSLATYKKLRDAPYTGRDHQELRRMIVMKAGEFPVLS